MNRQIVLIGRPAAIPGPEHFELRTGPEPSLPDNGLIAETVALSVDPAMRGWVSAEANYLQPVALGSVMRSLGVARVLKSADPDWNEGDLFYGWTGWQDRVAISPEAILWRVDESLAPPSAWLSVLGLNGLTAAKGFAAFARAKPGETMLVTTAAGGVGSIVGQLAKRSGMRTVGLTSASKCDLAHDRYGYDIALDYRDVDLAGALDVSCPQGVDIFWDNVGGEIADLIFPRLAPGGRVIQCGTASIPSWSPWPEGPRRERDMVVKRLTWSGFLAFDGDDHANEAALATLRSLVAAGELNHDEQCMVGLEQAPAALAALYQGQNSGRIWVKP
ncbi:MAG: hypothetical protein BGP16_14375 [Sphingobium sp. 66-54]|nr:MAG: hypothetical protein BGP16_14375 [Sphingobium sp. 66-54]